MRQAKEEIELLAWERERGRGCGESFHIQWGRSWISQRTLKHIQWILKRRQLRWGNSDRCVIIFSRSVYVYDKHNVIMFWKPCKVLYLLIFSYRGVLKNKPWVGVLDKETKCFIPFIPRKLKSTHGLHWTLICYLIRGIIPRFVTLCDGAYYTELVKSPEDSQVL